jgi:hypothetical protein
MAGPNLLPIGFGLAMAAIDIVMMTISKLTVLDKILYATGLLTATAVYTVQPYLFIKALGIEGMVAANLIWNTVSSIAVTLIGVFYFGESIKGLRILAIILALFSLGLFAYTDS